MPKRDKKHFGGSLEKNSEARPSSYYPDLSLPTQVIVSDLTRAAIVTILALLLQIGLYVYLQHGGWQKVLSALSNIKL